MIKKRSKSFNNKNKGMILLVIIVFILSIYLIHNFEFSNSSGYAYKGLMGGSASWVWFVPENPNDMVSLYNDLRVNKLYISLFKELQNKEDEKISNIINTLHGKGFKVYALISSNSVVTLGANGHKKGGVLEQTFDLVHAYNSRNPTAKFDGINADVEIKAEEMDEYIETLAYLKGRKGKLKFYIDIPILFAFTYPEKLKIMIDGSDIDAVNYMAYRSSAYCCDNLDGMIPRIEDLVNAVDVNFYMGVLADQNTEKTSFYGKSCSEMIQELKTVKRKYRKNKNFKGFVYHSYRSMDSLCG